MSELRDLLTAFEKMHSDGEDVEAKLEMSCSKQDNNLASTLRMNTWIWPNISAHLTRLL